MPDRKSFLFATWEGGGSVAPALTVARKLIARGHSVRFMSDACNRPETEAAGAAFVAWTRAPSRAERSPETDIIRDWECEGPEGLIRVIENLWTGPALAYAEDVIAELKREPADLVVTSEMLFGVAAGCEAIGQRFCYLTCNISLFPMPGVPPLGPGLPPPRDDAERAMHAAIAQDVVGLFDSGLPALNTAREALGLPPLAHTVDQGEAAVATLLGTARAFDFAPDALPPNVSYVGPQLDQPAWAEPWTCPWSADDRRPLVMVGFSTTFQDHAAVVQRVIDAAATLPVRLLVSLGGSLCAEALAPADNCRIVESAPHDEVMWQAAVVVTHGGHGTVTRALSHRLPMLVVPHGRDQNDNAVRVTERGAGLALPPSATAAEIRTALERLLSDPAFKQGATTLGAAVAQEAANSPVVSLLEDLVAAPVERTLCMA
jgi:UDP:flavonoid glycosyltransferase YjiC (YdhE family)